MSFTPCINIKALPFSRPGIRLCGPLPRLMEESLDLGESTVHQTGVVDGGRGTGGRRSSG